MAALTLWWALAERHRGRQQRRDCELRLRDASASTAEQGELHRLAILVAGGGSADAVCSAVAASAASLFDAQVGLVAHLAGDGCAELRGLSMSGPVSGYPAIGEDLNFTPHSAIGRLVRTGQTTRVNEGTASPFADRLGGRVAAPITLADGLWGVLAIAAAPGMELAAGVEDQLERFAGLVALAIGNAEAHEQLVIQATTDSLTGLANRRAFHDRLDQEVARARRHGRPLCLALLDVDRFKAVNDTFGHVAGDAVLVEASTRLQACVRSEVVLARIGGDEFAAILPETSLLQGEEIAQRVRATIAGAPFNGDLRVTLSIGVAALDSAGEAAGLRRAADEALYAVKAAGRDGVTCAPTSRSR